MQHNPSDMTRSTPSTQGITQRMNVIKIEDDEEEEAVLPIDLTELDDEQEGPETLRDITPSEAHSSRNLPFGYVTVNSTELHGETLTPGDSLEYHDGSFLYDIVIFEDLTTGLTMVDGIRMERLRCSNGMLTTTGKINELYMVLQAPTAGGDANVKDCRITQPLSAAICKRYIILTNKKFPAYSVYNPPHFWTNDKRAIKESAQLVCRRRLTEETANGKVVATSMMILSESECDEATRTSEACLFNTYQATQTPQIREKAIQEEWEDVEFSTDLPSKKRAHDAMRDSGPIDLTDDYDWDDDDADDDDVQIVKRMLTDTIERISPTGACVSFERTSVTTKTTEKPPTIPIGKFVPRRRSGVRYSPPRERAGPRSYRSPVFERFGDTDNILRGKYTYGDICVGAGGAASGAHQAGLAHNFLLDHWKPACETLRLNFKNMYTNILFKDIFQFYTKKERGGYEKVDVMHISYPCQTHSPAYTIVGKNHDRNSGALYSVGPLLEMCKPRIVTMEQTSGIVTHRGGNHFRALIRQITDAGYNVRWKIINMAEYGNVQPRKRLIIIAACPGEILPTFPEPTHGLGPGKLPFVTIRDVLRRLPSEETFPEHLRQYTSKNEPSYDPNVPLKQCITCSGGKSDLHPSGKRSFKLYELAALQGFLPKHRFFGNKRGSMGQIRTQIGNAVPSMFAKQLFEHIIKSLEKSDRKRAAWKPEPPVVIED